MDVKIPARIRKAFEIAGAARKNAHAPYSRYRVGAALVTSRGTVGGCNVENASYGATVCAERNCVLQAVARFGKGTKFEAIVVMTGESPPAPCCALCLQVLAEFCPADFPIYLADPRAVRSMVRLRDLLPRPFTEFVADAR